MAGQYRQRSSLTTQINKVAPINYEEVISRPLPFYDSIETILRCPLQTTRKYNEYKHCFTLTTSQADALAMSLPKTYAQKLLLRFFYLDKSQEQEDNFPHDAHVLINNTPVQLPPPFSNPNKPNIPPKRPGKAIDITTHCKLSPYPQNQLTVKWIPDPLQTQRSYVMTMELVTRLDATTLLNRIQQKGYIEESKTRQLIIEKLTPDPDCEIATETLQASLICPLGKIRMQIPCKSIQCQHMPCFDALLYLQMNEKKPTWICPVCYKPALFKDLLIDEMFKNILESIDSQYTEVQFHPDGSWTPISRVTNNTDNYRSYNESHEINLNEPPLKKPPIAPIEIVTISDSDDE